MQHPYAMAKWRILKMYGCDTRWNHCHHFISFSGGESQASSKQEFDKPCWHKMIEIVDFDKGLDFGPLLQFLFAHTSGYPSWISVNTSYQGMSVRPLRSAVIIVLGSEDFILIGLFFVGYKSWRFFVCYPQRRSWTKWRKLGAFGSLYFIQDGRPTNSLGVTNEKAPKS